MFYKLEIKTKINPNYGMQVIEANDTYIHTHTNPKYNRIFLVSPYMYFLLLKKIFILLIKKT